MSIFPTRAELLWEVPWCQAAEPARPGLRSQRLCTCGPRWVSSSSLSLSLFTYEAELTTRPAKMSGWAAHARAGVWRFTVPGGSAPCYSAASGLGCLLQGDCHSFQAQGLLPSPALHLPLDSHLVLFLGNSLPEPLGPSWPHAFPTCVTWRTSANDPRLHLARRHHCRSRDRLGRGRRVALGPGACFLQAHRVSEGCRSPWRQSPALSRERDPSLQWASPAPTEERV